MGKKLTKAQLYSLLADKSGMSKKQVAEFMDLLVNIGYKTVKSSGEFSIPGFGKLVKKRRKARMGRNPATGEQIKIPAKTVIKFRVSKAAKDAIL